MGRLLCLKMSILVKEDFLHCLYHLPWKLFTLEALNQEIKSKWFCSLPVAPMPSPHSFAIQANYILADLFLTLSTHSMCCIDCRAALNMLWAICLDSACCRWKSSWNTASLWFGSMFKYLLSKMKHQFPFTNKQKQKCSNKEVCSFSQLI